MRIWEARQEHACHRVLTGHRDCVTDVCFSRDSRLVASASRDLTAVVWRVDDGCVIRVLRGHANWVVSVCFSPTSSHVVTSASDMYMRVFSVFTGKMEQRLPSGTPRRSNYIVPCLAAHPTADLFASCSARGSVRTWTTGTWRPGISMRFKKTHVQCVAFSGDGQVLVAGNDVGGVRVFEPSMRQVLADLPSSPAPVMVLAVCQRPTAPQSPMTLHGSSLLHREPDTKSMLSNLPKETPRQFQADAIIQCRSPHEVTRLLTEQTEVINGIQSSRTEYKAAMEARIAELELALARTRSNLATVITSFDGCIDRLALIHKETEARYTLDHIFTAGRPVDLASVRVDSIAALMIRYGLAGSSTKMDACGELNADSLLRLTNYGISQSLGMPLLGHCLRLRRVLCDIQSGRGLLTYPTMQTLPVPGAQPPLWSMEQVEEWLCMGYAGPERDRLIQ